MVLAAQGEIDFKTFVMSDVGQDSENPATLAYLDEVAIPYAKVQGLKLEIIHRQWRSGKYRGLLQYMDEVESSIPIPVYLQGGGPSNRLCTIRWKMEPIERWQRDLGATAENPARLGLGISTDEIQRARTSSKFDTQELVYPLLDLNINRAECARIVADAGLPPAPKSSCWFCPYQSPESWRTRKRREPEVFSQAVELETKINVKRRNLGKDEAYLHRAGIPLERAVDDQIPLFEEDDNGCDSGHCWT